jgi:hypothetical protein
MEGGGEVRAPGGERRCGVRIGWGIIEDIGKEEVVE